MKQLNQKNLQNLNNKGNIELPEKLEKGYQLFTKLMNQAYEQLDLIQKYQNMESQISQDAMRE